MIAAVSFIGQLAGVLVVGSQPMSPAAMSTGSVAAPAGWAVAPAKARSCAVTRLPRQAAVTIARTARASGNPDFRIPLTRCISLPPGFKRPLHGLRRSDAGRDAQAGTTVENLFP